MGSWFGSTSRGGYEQANDLNDMESSTSNRRTRASVRFLSSSGAGATNNGNATSTPANSAAGIDRNTSIRSIMTLPVYRQTPGDSEQVLGREGDRDGVDVIVDMPTAEDEEQMREEEMRALYELRLARRQQIAEREERRAQRNAARQRNDTAALREIQERTRAASSSNSIEEMRAAHERLKQERQRTVSSVSYGELGVARHDGTRLRANSMESERMGLLSDAASIAATSTRSTQHRRHASQASILSMESDLPSPAYTRSRSGSRTRSPRITTAVSSPDPNEANGNGDTPIYSPPGYDDVSLQDNGSGATTPHNEPPPDYPGPSQRRASRLASEMAAAAQNGRAESVNDEHEARSSTSGAPQLPEIQVSPELPRIVVEPSSARP